MKAVFAASLPLTVVSAFQDTLQLFKAAFDVASELWRKERRGQHDDPFGGGGQVLGNFRVRGAIYRAADDVILHIHRPTHHPLAKAIISDLHDFGDLVDALATIEALFVNACAYLRWAIRLATRAF